MCSYLLNPAYKCGYKSALVRNLMLTRRQSYQLQNLFYKTYAV